MGQLMEPTMGSMRVVTLAAATVSLLGNPVALLTVVTMAEHWEGHWGRQKENSWVAAAVVQRVYSMAELKECGGVAW